METKIKSFRELRVWQKSIEVVKKKFTAFPKFSPKEKNTRFLRK